MYDILYTYHRPGMVRHNHDDDHAWIVYYSREWPARAMDGHASGIVGDGSEYLN